jgi:hypothetical protein
LTFGLFFLLRFDWLRSFGRSSSARTFLFFDMVALKVSGASLLLTKQATKKPLVASWSGEHRTNDEASSVARNISPISCIQGGMANLDCSSRVLNLDDAMSAGHLVEEQA